MLTLCLSLLLLVTNNSNSSSQITDKKEEIDITITSFLSATQDAESPWKKYYLSLSTT